MNSLMAATLLAAEFYIHWSCVGQTVPLLLMIRIIRNRYSNSDMDQELPNSFPNRFLEFEVFVSTTWASSRSSKHAWALWILIRKSHNAGVKMKWKKISFQKLENLCMDKRGNNSSSGTIYLTCSLWKQNEFSIFSFTDNVEIKLFRVRWFLRRIQSFHCISSLVRKGNGPLQKQVTILWNMQNKVWILSQLWSREIWEQIVWI